MAGYRGDGYGQYGDHDDEEYRFGDDRGHWRGERERRDERGLFRDERDDRVEHGAEHGNLMGRAEHRVRDWFEGRRDADRQAGDDPRGVRAADEWNRRFGREGHEGSYGQHLHDEPYRSFRQRHLEEMDRDYDAWRGERGQEFNRDFDQWRSRRRPADMTGQPDEMPALELSDAAHATAPGTPVTAAQQPAAAGSPASRRHGSSGSTPGGTAAPTAGQPDR